MIVNGTSHEINIYAIADTVAIQNGRKLVLKEGAKPLCTIAPGKDLNCSKENAIAPKLDFGFPVKGAVVFTGYDPIPDGDVVVVSNLYRSAVRDLGGDSSRLATVDGTVYESESSLRPCGCTALAIG